MIEDIRKLLNALDEFSADLVKSKGLLISHGLAEAAESLRSKLPTAAGESPFEKELRDLVNRHSLENSSNTPDFVLAQYLRACFDAFDAAVQQRETWYGRDARPFETKPPTAP